MTDLNSNASPEGKGNAKVPSNGYPYIVVKGFLALIVSFGLLLRLGGIGWSLPDSRHPFSTYHPDEAVNLAAARQADIPHGQFDIQFYNYGAFYFYLVSFSQTFGRGWHLIPDTPAAPAEDVNASFAASAASYAPENARLFLAGRLVTALLGTATIPVLFALGVRLYGRRAGLLAALLYALTPLAVVHAHFLTVDVPATFFVALALLWAVKLLEQPTARNYVVAGLWAGLAAATKYNAGLVLIAPLTAFILRRKGEPHSKTRLSSLFLLLGTFGLTFLIACPGPLLNWNVFWNGAYPGSGVRYELFQHSREGHGALFINTGPGWWYHLVISLRYGLGNPLLLLSLAGFAVACYRRKKGDKVLLAFFLFYYIATGFSAVRFARYMIPLYPVLCLWGARALTDSDLRWAKKPIASLLIGSIVVFFTGLTSLDLVRSMLLADPRDAVADRLEKDAPQGASVAFAKVPWFFSPPLSPRFGLLAAPQRAKAAEETTRFQLRIPTREWDTSVLNPPPDFVVVSNLETLHEVDRLKQPDAVQWIQAIPSDYQQTTYVPAPVFGLSLHAEIVPEDLLYILPTLTVFRK